MLGHGVRLQEGLPDLVELLEENHFPGYHQQPAVARINQEGVADTYISILFCLKDERKDGSGREVHTTGNH